MKDLIAELQAHRVARRTEPVLCYAPFSQLHFHLDGSVTVCSKNVHRSIGNIGTDRLRDLWQSPSARSIRESMRQFVFPPGCENCEAHLRRRNIRNNPLLDFDQLPIPQGPEWPARLEFAFSDLCNLGCRHCSPNLSSVLRKRAGMPARCTVYDDRFFADIEAFLPHVEQISFLGGEPFLHPEVHRLLDMLVAAGLSPKVHVTTNGTVCNQRILKWLEALPISMSVSVDGVTAATFRRMRGTSLDHVLQNVARFRPQMTRKHQRLQLNFCVTKSTWHELPDYLLMVQRMNANTWVSVVTAPPRTSVFGLGRPALQRMLTTLRARERELQGLPDHLAAIWQSVLDTIDNAVNEPERSRFGFGIARAMALHEQGRSRSARAVAAEVDETNPYYDIARDLLAGAEVRSVDARVWEAERHFEVGDMSEAEPLLEAAAQQPDCEPGVFVRLASVRLKQGKPEQGLQHLQELARRVDLDAVDASLARSVAAIAAELRSASEKAQADCAPLPNGSAQDPHPDIGSATRATGS